MSLLSFALLKPLPESGSMTMVDGTPKARGLDGLRVIDCSIIPSRNINAPAMMIGSKAAEMIGSDYRQSISAIE